MKHTFGYGETWVSGSTTTALTGSWYGVKTILDSVFSTLENTDGIDVLADVTIPAGTEIESHIAYANLTSGVAVLYYGKEDNMQKTNLNYKGITNK